MYETISSNTGVSVADIIILGGNVGIEKASGRKLTLRQVEVMHRKSKLILSLFHI